MHPGKCAASMHGRLIIDLRMSTQYNFLKLGQLFAWFLARIVLPEAADAFSSGRGICVIATLT